MSGDDAKKVKRANKREVEEAVDEAVDEQDGQERHQQVQHQLLPISLHVVPQPVYQLVSCRNCLKSRQK